MERIDKIWGVLFFLGLILYATAQTGNSAKGCLTMEQTCGDMLGLCMADTCHNGGSCRDSSMSGSVSYWWCDCPYDKTGSLCEIEMSDKSGTCDSVTCENNGTCMDMSGGTSSADSYWWCNCPPGTTGDRCEVDMTGYCSSGNCENGGTCMDIPGTGPTWWCQCPPEKSGARCEIDIIDTTGTCDMASSACQNGGTCRDGITHWCECQSNTYGPHCEYYGGTDWSVCDSNPCPEGHACVEDTGGAGYSCECPKGTMGVDCRDDDTTYDACFDPENMNVCQNGGTCERKPFGKYKCICAMNYHGDSCTEEVQPGTKLMIEMYNCESLYEMTEDRTETLESWCATMDMEAPDYSKLLIVRVLGMEPGEVYRFEIVTFHGRGEDPETESSIEKEITAPTDTDQVTDQVKGMQYTTPASVLDPSSGKRVCYNNEAKLSLRVTKVTDENLTYKTEDHRVTVLCDSSGVDLSLTTSIEEEHLGAITATEQTLGTLTSATFTAAASGNLPLLGMNTPYYIIVFLTKRESIGCASPEDVPDVTFEDHILGYFRFRDETELAGVDDFLKNIQIIAPDRCGDYKLVILIDAMVSIKDEADRCNNFVVMKITLPPCDTNGEKPRCHVIPNPFANGHDTALIFQQHDTLIRPDPEARLFKNGDFMAWTEEMNSDTDQNRRKIYKVMRLGYGRLKALELFIKDDIKDKEAAGNSPCSNIDEAAVSQMESLEPELLAISGPALENMIPAYSSAGTMVSNLQDEATNTPSSVLIEVQGALDGLSVPNDTSPFREHLQNWVSKTAFETVKEISGAKMQSREMELKREARSNLCRVGDSMGKLTYIKKAIGPMSDVPEWIYYEMAKLVGNITRSMIMKKMYYSNARFANCLDEIFVRVVKFVDGEVTDDSWLYDQKCRSKSNGCLMKVKALCGSHSDDCNQPSNFIEDKVLCEMRQFSEMMNREYKALGLHDLRRYLREYTRSQNNEDGNKGKCHGEEHIIPQLVPLQLYSLDDNGTIWKGMTHVNQAESKVCWRAVAVCTCTDCPAATGGSGYGGSGYGGSGSGSGYGGSDYGGSDFGGSMKRRKKK